jgi:hypothetical protein
MAAKKLPKVPDLSFNVIFFADGPGNSWCRAYQCIEHPEIEVRIHSTPFRGKKGKTISTGPWRQVFLVDDEEQIEYGTVKAAYRALIARDPDYERPFNPRCHKENKETRTRKRKKKERTS